MNEKYRTALQFLQTVESDFNEQEIKFKSAFNVYSEARNTLNDHSRFDLNFADALKLVNDAEHALDSGDYDQARDLGQQSLDNAVRVIEDSMPNLVIEAEVDNFFKAGGQKKFDIILKNTGKVEATDITITFTGSMELIGDTPTIDRIGAGEEKTISAIGVFQNYGDNPFGVEVSYYNQIQEDYLNRTLMNEIINVLNEKGRDVDGSSQSRDYDGSIDVQRDLISDGLYDRYVVHIANNSNKVMKDVKIKLIYDDSKIIPREKVSGKKIDAERIKVNDLFPDDQYKEDIYFDVFKSGIHRITGRVNFKVLTEVKGKEREKSKTVDIEPLSIDRTEIYTDFQTKNDLAQKHLSSLLGIRENLLMTNMLVDFQESVNMPKGVDTEDTINYFNEAIESADLIKRPVTDDNDLLDVYYFGAPMGQYIGMHFEVDKREKNMNFDYFSSHQETLANLIERVRKAFNKVLEERGASTIVYADNYVATAEAGDALGKHQAAAKMVTAEMEEATKREKIKADKEVAHHEIQADLAKDDNKMAMDMQKAQMERNLEEKRIKAGQSQAPTQKPEMSPAEAVEQYTKLLKDFYDDGVILPVEQKILDRFRTAHGIQDIVADELENEVKRELGLLDGGGA